MDLLTIADLTELLKVSRTTIWRWQRQGYLPPPSRIGPRRPVWRREVIEEWIKEQT
ncbi:MAG: helix-turn-helix transcriptional regulator [Methylohalobius sp. ZOD2]